ncbi:MAG: phosphoenolpyruvate--protein phosphotransferase [Alphaproteobacteria bacterium]|nr:phosphoenolpyruvate--protein phosphotransferase [Alphaproteobacteria bacterium]
MINKKNKADKLLQKLQKIAMSSLVAKQKVAEVSKTVAEVMSADVFVCCLLADNKYLECLSNFGLDEDIEDQWRADEDEIGKIALEKNSVVINNLDEVYDNFVFGEELRHKNMKSFAGVAIVQWNRCLGVVGIFTKKALAYGDDDLAFLKAVAMFVSDMLSMPDVAEYIKQLQKIKGVAVKDKIKAVSLNKGYGIGQAIIHNARRAITNIFAEDKNQELERLRVAHEQMNDDLDSRFNAAKLGLGEHVDILEAYRMFAKDKGWYKKIADNIEGGLSAEAAVERAYEDMWNRLSASDDAYLKERLHDLRDVANRLLSYLAGDFGKNSVNSAKDIILVAQSMGPAELMDYDYTKIRGLVLEEGTPTMHVAIVAKALNIPVLSKVKNVLAEVQNGQKLAIDGNEGIIYLSPSQDVENKFYKKIAEAERLQQKFAELRKLPSVTKDKQKIGMYINVGLPLDFEYVEKTNCDGVGLYRTEIPFMTSINMPDVDQQVAYYKDLTDVCGKKKVIFRTLDVGSDKILPYWGYKGESNPAIGWRSIRITLDRRAILRKQVKAFLLAAAGRELDVMFPMISNCEEFLEAKATLMLELEKMRKRGLPLPKKVNVGLMVEVPAVLYQLDNILPNADFVSVGTNDLAQFVFACDRGNPQLLDRYDVLSAPFLRVMKDIVDKAKKNNVYCSVCGEMASNPIEALALVGLGYQNLSCNGAAFAKVKSMIRSINKAEVEDYVVSLLNSPRASLRSQLIAYANDHAIEIY